MTLEIDEFDRKIIGVMLSDASLPISSIARLIKRNKEFCSYRIQRLYSQGIISQPFALVNLKRFGYTTFNAIIRASSFTPDSNITRYLAQTQGSWDYEISFAAQSAHDVATCITAFYEQASSVSILIRKKRIVSDRFEKFFPQYTDKRRIARVTHHSLTSIDFAVLRELSQDASIPIAQLALKLKKQPHQIRYLKQSLERQGFISGYRVHVNTEKLGLLAYNYLISTTQSVFKNIEAFLKQNTHVIHAVHVCGEFDFRVQALFSTQQEALDFMRELRDIAQDNLIRSEQALFVKTIRRASYPL